MKKILDNNRNEKIKKNKDRDLLNRLVAARFFSALVGGISAYPAYQYFGWTYALLPLILLAIGVALTIPIEHYRQKYNLKKYQDIVSFFDEKYAE